MKPKEKKMKTEEPMTSKEMPVAGLITDAGNSKKFKTGDWRTYRPVWDKEKCIHCMMCVKYCPENCIAIKNGKRTETDFDYCKGCMICEQVCPVKCISRRREGDETCECTEKKGDDDERK